LKWRRIIDNVLSRRKFSPSHGQSRDRARDLVALAGSPATRAKYPYELSGGMQPARRDRPRAIHDPSSS